MALSDIDQAAVLRAVQEFDRHGRDAFLQRNGFGRSHAYFLRREGKLYDSKAFIGVAHGFSGGGRRPLAASDFTGGDFTREHRRKAMPQRTHSLMAHLNVALVDRSSTFLSDSRKWMHITAERMISADVLI